MKLPALLILLCVGFASADTTLPARPSRNAVLDRACEALPQIDPDHLFDYLKAVVQSQNTDDYWWSGITMEAGGVVWAEPHVGRFQADPIWHNVEVSRSHPWVRFMLKRAAPRRRVLQTLGLIEVAGEIEFSAGVRRCRVSLMRNERGIVGIEMR